MKDHVEDVFGSRRNYPDREKKKTIQNRKAAPISPPVLLPNAYLSPLTFADTFHFITSVNALLLFPPQIPHLIFQGFIPMRQVSFILNLPTILHLHLTLCLIFDKSFTAARLSVVRAAAVCFLAPGLLGSELFCVPSCMLRGRLASQSVSMLTET